MISRELVIAGLRPAILARAVTLRSCDCVSSRAKASVLDRIGELLGAWGEVVDQFDHGPRRGRSLYDIGAAVTFSAG
jgi:hypothetical protein